MDRVHGNAEVVRRMAALNRRAYPPCRSFRFAEPFLIPIYNGANYTVAIQRALFHTGKWNFLGAPEFKVDGLSWRPERPSQRTPASRVPFRQRPTTDIDVLCSFADV